MSFDVSFSLLLDNLDMYYELLQEEDFDFRTKDIEIEIQKDTKNSKLNIKIKADSLIDMKIANSAIIKSLEIIKKTLEI